MECVLRRAANALAIVSVASFAIAALSWEGFLGGANRKGLRLEPAVLSLGDLPPATSVSLIFKAINSSSRPIRVVGVQNTCSLWGCVGSGNLPCVIPPHSSSNVVLALKTNSAVVLSRGTTDGKSFRDLAFDADVKLYSDCPKDNIISLRVSGKVVCAEAENSPRRVLSSVPR
jgi:hypothetical protein